MMYQIVVPTNARLARNITEHTLADKFGGWTSYAAIGGWQVPGTDMKREPMTVYTAAKIGGSMTGPAAIALIRELADLVRRLAVQDAVFYGVTPGAFYLATDPAWSGSPAPDDPDNTWIDDVSGERKSA